MFSNILIIVTTKVIIRKFIVEISMLFQQFDLDFAECGCFYFDISKCTRNGIYMQIHRAMPERYPLNNGIF